MWWFWKPTRCVHVLSFYCEINLNEYSFRWIGRIGCRQLYHAVTLRNASGGSLTLLVWSRQLSDVTTELGAYFRIIFGVTPGMLMMPILSLVLNVDIIDEPNAACHNLDYSTCESIFKTSDDECSTGALLVCWLDVAGDDCIVSSIIQSFVSRFLFPRISSFPFWWHTLIYSMSHLS